MVTIKSRATTTWRQPESITRKPRAIPARAANLQVFRAKPQEKIQRSYKSNDSQESDSAPNLRPSSNLYFASLFLIHTSIAARISEETSQSSWESVLTLKIHLSHTENSTKGFGLNDKSCWSQSCGQTRKHHGARERNTLNEANRPTSAPVFGSGGGQSPARDEGSTSQH